jgi:hypothetical protein
MEGDRPDAPAGLFLSRRGNWFHDGQRVKHERLELLLTGSIARDAAGGLIVTTGRDVLPFVAEDAPVVVVAVDASAAGVFAVCEGGHREAVVDVVIGRDDRFRAPLAGKTGAGFWGVFTKSAGQTLESLLDDDGRLHLGPRVVDIAVVETDWSAAPPRSTSMAQSH